MSRPRKPYGPTQPGRLAATMVKVLAAELSDAGRLSRGKRYWAEDAVIDIVIGHGAVTAEVQGSRREPYVVTIEADGGTGVPTRSEIWIRCTCPDDTGTGRDACKHAVAAMFALSDEIAIEPAVIERWRASRRRSDAGATVTQLPPAADPDDTAERDRPATVVPLRPGGVGAAPHEPPPRPVVEVDPSVDQIARLVAAPTGVVATPLPDVDPADPLTVPDPTLAAVLSDALDHLAIRWE